MNHPPQLLGMTTSTLAWLILFAALILSAAILYRRYQSRRILVQRVAELEALATAGRSIVGAELDLEALSKLIAIESGLVIDNSTFQVGIFDGSFYKILYWTIEGDQQPVPQSFDLSENSGVVGWIREHHQPLLVYDFQKEMATLPARPRYISSYPPRSAIFVPMISGEAVIGIIAAQSKEPDRFNEDDLRRLTILANQAAAAIANAQLYEQASQRAAHLELVVKIAQEVNAINELDDIFNQVVYLVRKTFGFHPVSIFGLRAATREAEIKASTLPALLEARIQIPEGVGIIGTAVSQAGIIIANNTHDDPRFIQTMGRVSHPDIMNTRAEIALPLIVDDQLLGILDVQSPQPGAFGPTEKTVLEALAAAAAAAIHKTEQFTRQQEQAWGSTVQLQITEAMSRSNDVEQGGWAVTRLLSMLLGLPVCALLLRDEEDETGKTPTAVYKAAAVYGLPPDQTKAFQNRRITTGQWPPLDAMDIGQTLITTTHFPEWLCPTDDHNFTEMQLWPLKTDSNKLGALIVACEPAENSLEGERWVRQRQELLSNLSDQISQVLERSLLRIALQEEGWVNTALLQVAEAVNSLIDLNDILNTIVRLVPMLVGVESAIILVWDDNAETYRVGSSYGLSEMGRGLLDSLKLDPQELDLSPLAVSDDLPPGTAVYAVRQPLWFEQVMDSPITHAFPLNAGGRQVGTMLVGTSDENQSISGRRLAILNGIAQQAATAVVNSHLYAEAAERNRLAQELEVAREIQSSLLPKQDPDIPGCTVASYWQAARQVSGDFYDFMHLDDQHWGIVVADVADKGIPAALFMALSRTILRAAAFSRRDPAETLVRVNEIIDADAQSDLFVTVCYAIWNWQKGTLTYANGGHNPPLLLRENGELKLLKGKGMALGVLPQITIEPNEIHLHPGDTLVFYTDGVTEAMNEDYDEFGMERLRLAAQSAAQLDATAVRDAILTAVKEHVGETPQFDDLTLVVMKLLPQ